MSSSGSPVRSGSAPGRRAFIAFIAIVVLALAQIGWWILFLSRIAESRRQVFMILSEAIVFLIALLGGVFILYRTLTEQVRLKHMQATFLSAVTHELKSPLAAIRLLLETVESGRVKDAAKVRDLVGKSLLDVDRLEQLVNDLLCAGQLEQHDLQPSKTRLDFTALVREVAERARPRLIQEGDALKVTADRPIPIDGDPALLESVVLNLIENAAKYSPPPRAISVALAEREGRAELTVRDQGVGLDAEDRAQVFLPFFRAGDEETRTQRGTGLGLFLVQGIVRAHGGDCTVESAGHGQGSVFRVRLPLASGDGR
ncbi:MAG: sensor histidine kinase [Planctomycetota bacterium]|jgi:signal transduction histidine kinase